MNLLEKTEEWGPWVGLFISIVLFIITGFQPYFLYLIALDIGFMIWRKLKHR